MQVSAQVVFDWEPPCPVLYLSVYRLTLDGSEGQWSIRFPFEPGINEENIIMPPVTYGVVPAGAAESRDPEILVEGEIYNVSVGRLVGRGLRARRVLSRPKVFQR